MDRRRAIRWKVPVSEKAPTRQTQGRPLGRRATPAHASTRTQQVQHGARRPEADQEEIPMTQPGMTPEPSIPLPPPSMTTDAEVRPFSFTASDEALADLRRRIAATEWPEKETVTDQSQGVPLAMIRELARYWATAYDWRKVEARLHALPQFVTEIDGLDI